MKKAVFTGLAAAAVATTASADFTSAVAVSYSVTAADFGGAEVSVNVQDIYLMSDDATDALLNVYNWNSSQTGITYFQSFTGTGWVPTNLGGPFDTAALQQADSFVTIGGFDYSTGTPLQSPGAGAGVGVDPSFGGNNAAEPGMDAGWYNSSPPSLIGRPGDTVLGLGTLIGRFTSTLDFSLSGTLEVTWNNGLGTPGVQATFTFGGGFIDCNQNGVPDAEDIAYGTSEDCNGNGRPDECDVSQGYSSDCNGNGVPDECEPDCNGNGNPDDCDIDWGWSNDCNTNGIPDECDPDCNANGYPDDCEIDWGWSNDCNANGTPDECEPDCDFDGLPDACEIADGLAVDYNQNGVPDSCEALTVPGDFESIADAAANAPEGSVIFVSGGSYEDAITLDRAIAIIAPEGPALTKLDGAKSLGPVVIADGAPEGAILAGFTIRAGDPSAAHPLGGGVVGVNSSITIADCVIVGNTGMNGGGLRFEGGSPAVIGCEIRGNLAYDAGGGLHTTGGECLIEDSAFIGNIALGGDGQAMSFHNVSLTEVVGCDVSEHLVNGSALRSTSDAGLVPVTFAVRNTTLTNNTGTAIEGGHPNVEVTDCLIEFNGGDGISIVAGSSHIIDRNSIRGQNGTGLAIETGIASFQSIADNTICGNIGGGVVGADTTELFGAGNLVFDDRCPDRVVPDDADSIQAAIGDALDGERIAVRPGTWEPFRLDARDLEVIATEDRDSTVVAGPWSEFVSVPASGLVRGFTFDSSDPDDPGTNPLVRIIDSELRVEDCVVRNHTVGGITVGGSGHPTVRDTLVTGNSADSGAGILLESGSLTLERVTITENSIPLATESRGGGVLVAEAAELILIDTTVCDNVRENLAGLGTISDGGGNTICLAFDCDANGVEDASDIGDLGRPDCNGNLVPDDCDIAGGTSFDCDANGVPDECDIAGGKADCDGNGIIDACEVSDGSAPDCNQNGIPDVCDLASGTPDLDLDGVPDECQTVLIFVVPDRFTTVTSAIDAAPSGSIVTLAPGIYAEAIDLGSKNLVIEGDSTDPSATTLDGTGLDTSIVRIAGGQDDSTILRGLTIANGAAGTPEPGNPSVIRGAGMLIMNASPTIEDCVFTNNRTGYGAGLHASGSAASIVRCAVVANVATADGAGAMAVDSNVAFTDCTFTGNVAGSNGGGLRVNGGQSTLTTCTLSGNDAFQGGGLFWYSVPSGDTSLLLDGCEITQNTAATLGGGVWSRLTGSPAEFLDTTICDNEPDEIYGAFLDLGGNDLCLCLGDLNGDGQVGPIDLGILLGSFGPCSGETCPADLDLDGRVDAPDLGLILGAWGVCP